MPPVAASSAGAGGVGGAAPALRRPFKLPALRKPAQVAPDSSTDDHTEKAPLAVQGKAELPDEQPPPPPASAPLPALLRPRLPGLRGKKRPAAALTGPSQPQADDSAQAEAVSHGPEECSHPVAAPTSAAPARVPASPQQLPSTAAEQAPAEQRSEQQKEPASMNQKPSHADLPAGWRSTRLPAVMPDSLPPPPAPAAMPPATKLLGK